MRSLNSPFWGFWPRPFLAEMLARQLRDRARKVARRRNLLQLLQSDGSGKTSIVGRREEPNHWRALTRLEAAVRVAHLAITEPSQFALLKMLAPTTERDGGFRMLRRLLFCFAMLVVAGPAAADDVARCDNRSAVNVDVAAC